MTCKECGTTTGGGEYCYQHAPYMVWPKADGSFLSDRNGRKRIYLDDLAESIVPHQETAPLTAIRAQIVEMRAEALRTGWPDGPAKIAHLLNKHADALEKAFLALASPLAEGYQPADPTNRFDVDAAAAMNRAAARKLFLL